MANYTYQEAVDFIRKYIKDIPLAGSNVDKILCDQVNSIIHCAYPWRWTQKALTAISLTDDAQDYTITDSDFFRPVNLRIARTDITPVQHRELTIAEFLPPESHKGGLESIRQIAFLPVGTKFRLSMRAHIVSPVVLQIQGEFQFAPTKITALTGNILHPDHYFTVFTEGLLWRAYKYADDDRAGTIQVVKNGGIVYTGQMGVFYALLQQMREAEDQLGEPLIFPETPLGAGDAAGSYGLFGTF